MGYTPPHTIRVQNKTLKECVVLHITEEFVSYFPSFKKTKAKDTRKENQYLLDHFQITDNLQVSKFAVHTFLRSVSGGMYVPIRIISPTSLIKFSHVYDVRNFQNFVQ